MVIVPDIGIKDISKLLLSKTPTTAMLPIAVLFSLLVPSFLGFDLRLLFCSFPDPFIASILPQRLQQFYKNLRYQTCPEIVNLYTTTHELKDLFYYLGGNGPWIPKHRDVIGHAIAPPEGCEVQQVHMLSRHTERYPTKSAGERHLALLKRLDPSSEPLNSAFSFLQNWTYFTPQEDPAFELLTSTSQHAGTLEAFNTGVKLRTRYEHLIPGEGNTTRFWSASSSRDVASALYFADGFFGREWDRQRRAELQIIPETADLGGDTLTSGITCLNYRTDEINGRDQGYAALADWQKVYIDPIKKRLEHRESSLRFTPVEIYSMMEMCGFEMLVRDGISPWCNLFDQKDWLNFEYARDLLHFYRAGPGNRYSRAMGGLWLEATSSLLEKGPDAGTLFFSFVHDGDIIPMLSALGYPRGYDEQVGRHLPRDRNIRDRAYKTSDITPMGGRAIFERLKCTTADGDEVFIRLNINDGVIPIGHDTSGPGNSTRLSHFKEYLSTRRRLAGDFKEICGLDKAAPNRITFLHQ